MLFDIPFMCDVGDRKKVQESVNTHSKSCHNNTLKVISTELNMRGTLNGEFTLTII